MTRDEWKLLGYGLLVVGVFVLLGIAGTALKAWLFGQFIGGCPA